MGASHTARMMLSAPAIDVVQIVSSDHESRKHQEKTSNAASTSITFTSTDHASALKSNTVARMSRSISRTVGMR